ncbi:tetratricopeptide (TPR) repeat protein [Oxalobacteraceae bacterium GrIS 2.11]
MLLNSWNAVHKMTEAMHSELNDYVERISTALAQHRTHSFSSQREVQLYLQKTKKEILQALHKSGAMLVEGLRILEDRKSSHVERVVSGYAAKLLKHLDSSKKLTAIIEDILQDERSVLCFNEVVNSFYECGDFHQELCVIIVFMTLFPFNPQPHISLGVLTWRRDGIDTAEHYYDSVVDAINNPALDYYAAECFYKNGKRGRAKDILNRALSTVEKSPEIYGDKMMRDLRGLFAKV